MAEIVLPHQFKDGVNETASGVQVMDNLIKLREEIEKLVRDATHELLRVQTGVFSVPGFGGGTWGFEITLPHAWPTAHVSFIAGCAISPTENKGWPCGGEPNGLGKGRVRGIGGGPNFEAANIQWVSVGL